MEDNIATHARPLPTWPIAVAIPSGLVAVVVLLLFIESAASWRVMTALLVGVALGVLLVADRISRGRIQGLTDAAEEVARKAAEMRENLKSRDAEIIRLQADGKRRTTAFESERDTLTARLAKVTAELAESRAALDSLQSAVGQLKDQNSMLQSERADAIQRRQLLQAQYQELENTSRALGSSHTERTAQYRAAMDSAEQVRSELERLRASETALETECQKLRHQVERLELERRSFDLRERALRDEVELSRRNVAEAMSRAESASAQRGLHEELAARRAELDRLADEIAHLKSQLDMARERAALAEQAREDAASTIRRLEEQVAASDAVIGELQDEVRNVSTESRSDMAKHFTWRLNFFESNEVRLSFVNDGATVDLVEVKTEPALNCGFDGARRLERGGDGAVVIRPNKGAKAPDDFRVTIRYTLRPQEASFRIRPYAPNKIERL